MYLQSNTYCIIEVIGESIKSSNLIVEIIFPFPHQIMYSKIMAYSLQYRIPKPIGYVYTIKASTNLNG